MRKSFFSPKLLVASILYFSLIVITALYITIPDSASEEYRYTIQVLFKYLVMPCFLVTTAVLSYKILSGISASCKSIIKLGIVGIVCVLVPILSPNIYQVHWIFGICYSLCWIAGTLCLALFCFAMVRKLKGFSSGIFSILGTLFFLWMGAETLFLVFSQTEDGKYSYVKTSKHVLNNDASPDIRPIEKKSGLYLLQPAHASHSVADAVRRYDKTLYDVRYTLDKYGHRVVAIHTEKPKADLLLFGCSYTFGHGLENEQTWPWKLSIDLGPDWLVTDYALNGFGAQQMLGMLEEHELEPLPQAPRREALFLSIRAHIHRHTGIYYSNKSIKYKLVDNKLEREGYNTDSALHIIPSLPFILNGSQCARGLAQYLAASYINKNQEELLATYAAMIIRSSQILKKEYGTRLTVLLWPDIEDLAPILEKENIPVLFARAFLKSWDSPNNEQEYQIVPKYEVHPNEKVTDELAVGIADYFKKLADSSAKNAMPINNP